MTYLMLFNGLLKGFDHDVFENSGILIFPINNPIPDYVLFFPTERKFSLEESKNYFIVEKRTGYVLIWPPIKWNEPIIAFKLTQLDYIEGKLNDSTLLFDSNIKIAPVTLDFSNKWIYVDSEPGDDKRDIELSTKYFTSIIHTEDPPPQFVLPKFIKDPIFKSS